MTMVAVSETPSEATAETSRFPLARALRNQVQAVGVTLTMATLFVVTGLHNPYFWELNNIRVLAMNMSFIALAGVGTAILIISGNIDLSIGSMLGLTAVLTGLFAQVMPVPLAFIFGAGVGGLIGAANGILVWNVSASPLIVTLGVMTLLRGVIYVVTRGEAVTGLPQSFVDFANMTPAGVPMPVWFAAGAVLLGFLFLTFTKAGRHIYAIGGNREASRAAGIRVRRLVIGAFLVNGLLVGLTGALQASLYSAPDQTFGTGFELQVITAVIVGGVSFAGGEGGVIRAIIGVALLEVVSGSVVAFNIDPNYAYILTGAILILAVSIDQIVHKNRERFQKAMAMRERARYEAEHRGAATDEDLVTGEELDPVTGPAQP
jgi:ribose/xylose/arabinose/galactoside ABC-type transport system permease subunit